MHDIAQKVLIAVASSMTLALVYWINRKFVTPLTRVASLIDDVAAIKKEVQSNSGQSLKDLCVATSDSMAIVEARQRGLMATMASAMFEADAHFNWTDGNMSVERLTGYGFPHLAHRRWISGIHDDDRSDVMREIEFAVADQRTVSISFRFVSSAGAVIPVRLEAMPIFSKSVPSKVLCWSGSLLKESDDRRVVERRHD